MDEKIFNSMCEELESLDPNFYFIVHEFKQIELAFRSGEVNVEERAHLINQIKDQLIPTIETTSINNRYLINACNALIEHI